MLKFQQKKLTFVVNSQDTVKGEVAASWRTTSNILLL